MADPTDPSQRLREQVEEEERKLRRALRGLGGGGGGSEFKPKPSDFGPGPIPYGPGSPFGLGPEEEDPPWKEQWWDKYVDPIKEKVDPIMNHPLFPGFGVRDKDKKGRPLRYPLFEFKWE